MIIVVELVLQGDPDQFDTDAFISTMKSLMNTDAEIIVIIIRLKQRAGMKERGGGGKVSEKWEILIF